MISKDRKFTNKVHPLRGIFSTVLGFISLVSLMLSVALCFKNILIPHERLGAAGFIGLIFSIAGFVLSVLSLKEPDIYRFFPVLGMVLSVLGFLGWSNVAFLGLGYI